jgi:hypothetical protein
LLVLNSHAFNSLQLCGSESAASRESYGREPELRTIRIPLHVDVRRFVAVRRIKEKPVRTFAKNRRHRLSVPRASPIGIRSAERAR